MIETPQVVQVPARFVARIHLTIPRAEIRHVMGPGLGEIMAAVTAQGLGPTGAWFTHHHQMHPDTFDFDICVPVSQPVSPVGRVHAGEVSALTVVRTIYQGAYEGLAGAWSELHTWAAAEGHLLREDLFEHYLAGPESSPDPANWRTELMRPTAGIGKAT